MNVEDFGPPHQNFSSRPNEGRPSDAAVPLMAASRVTNLVEMCKSVNEGGGRANGAKPG